MIEVYRGSANTWECDEMGHMNVRFYVAKMTEGLAAFACETGMPHAFRPRARSTLLPRDQHIRFLREARAGQPLVMHAGVLAVENSSVQIYQQIDHVGGEPCATFRTWVDHVDAETGLAFPWSPRARVGLEAQLTQAPANIGPRSIDMDIPPRAEARMSDAVAIGAPVIGRGVVQSNQCDQHGRMLAEFFIGRVSDSISNLLGPWRAAIANTTAGDAAPMRIGGAVLEYRVVYRRWPVAGQRLVIQSARGAATGKTHSFIHWILDPESGEAWCTSEAVAVSFDLDTRKIIPAPPGHLEELAKIAPEGLTT